jgi:hypothetical protein
VALCSKGEEADLSPHAKEVARGHNDTTVATGSQWRLRCLRSRGGRRLGRASLGHVGPMATGPAATDFRI